MNKTTEALHTKVTGPEGVVDMPGGKIVAIKGPKFLEYVTDYIMPRRFDTAQLALSALLQSNGPIRELEIPQLVKDSYELADEMMLNERVTLDSVMDRYWEAYMTREDKTEDVMRSLVEESKDYSL